jgi:hypothetical protein
VSNVENIFKLGSNMGIERAIQEEVFFIFYPLSVTKVIDSLIHGVLGVVPA